ncbi:molecular chaperone [Yersinia pseudotuberculosis]|uniref:fimbrial biogenesis chaperone n=1 Tax=Yersinia pseudotuberculosis TaxID=633 RepID=UPI0005AD22F3|nr:molecular chaperone [Yersinia pseudotuberculosis]AJK14696.1 hypothetical protein BZ19_1733 [Yersinia pseudotuberculosis str. PA3606]
MKTLWLILRPRARKVNNLRTLLITAILSSLVLSATVQAGVAIGLTRVIVTGADKSGSVQILNDGLHPALLQLWVDNNIAEMDKPIEQINVPFVVDSPVFRLNAKTNKSIRIYYTGGANQLPSDRESMFWLNVLEVPPKASANQSSQNAVQIAFRSRIKLFYRPAGIPISSEGVATKLSFTLVPKGEGRVLRVANPTPFNVTFQTLAITQSHTAQGVTIKLGADDMVGPKSSVDSAPVSNNVLAKNMSVFFSIIDDFGSPIEGQQPLQ